MIDEEGYKNQLRYAQTQRGLDPGKQDYWAGYMRGIRRGYHGTDFGTMEEHLTYWDAFTSLDESRKQLGIGYRDGIKFCKRVGRPAGAPSVKLIEVWVPLKLRLKMDKAAKKLNVPLPEFRKLCYEEYSERVLQI